MPNGLFYLNYLVGPFPIKGVSGSFSFLPCFIEIHAFNANSVDPYQMPHSTLFANVPFMGK